MKKIFYLIMILCLTFNFAEATQLPLKITPTEVIKTSHDEIEVGDKLLFKLVSDAKIDNKVIFEAGTPVVVYVDYRTENGWSYDSANIWCRKVWLKKDGTYTKAYDTDFSINGFKLLRGLQPPIRRFFEYIGIVFRGKEINFDPKKDKYVTIIWIDY